MSGIFRTAAATALAAAAVAALAACSGTSDPTSASGPTSPPASTPRQTRVSASGEVTPSEQRPSGSVTSPVGDERMQLLVIVEAVNPRIGTDEDRLVQDSIAVCRSMRNGTSASAVLDLTRRQFTRGGYTPSPAEADAVDRAIVATFCR